MDRERPQRPVGCWLCGATFRRGLWRATGKVAFGGDYTVAQNDGDVETPRTLGLWLDPSRQDPDETVAEILDRRGEARVE